MRRVLSFLFFIVLLTSCKKSDPVSACIESKISEFKASGSACDHGASVKEYRFQGKLVYVFDQGNCIADGGAVVRDRDCNIIGWLGGFVGNVVINGVDFYDHAEYKRTVWHN